MAGRKLHRPGFEQWLRSQPKTKVVGYSNDRIRCPFSVYLGSSVEYGSQPVSLWARDFMKIIDGEDGEVRPITVEEALGALEQIPDHRGRKSARAQEEDESEEVEDFDLLLGEI